MFGKEIAKYRGCQFRLATKSYFPLTHFFVFLESN